jgi:PD-(D/E)XK nuclease superfamily
VTDPFAKHNIDHLSPSALNCYLEQPAFWVMKYLYRDRFKDEVGPSAWRGHAVEAGVDLYLMTQPPKRNLSACIEAAGIRYELDAQGDLADDVEKERKNVTLILQQAIEALGDTPVPDARQVKIELWFDGIEVPVQGFIDYVWPEGCLDLKSTLRMPSEIPHNHARQVSIYTKAKERPCGLLYVTPTKSKLQHVVDVDKHLAYLERQAKAIRNLLWVCDDREQVAQFFLPDPDHFYWKRDEAKQAAETIWR